MRILVLLLSVLALEAVAGAPRAAADPAYIPDRTCIACHREAGRAWRASHHARAMQPANSTTVRGDFRDRELGEGSDAVRLFRRGGGFFARARGADGLIGDHRILYTFGVEPLQQYLVAAPGGRLQALTAAWDTGRRRWFSLDGEGAPPGDAMHWSGRYRNWNLMCAECHSSGVRKNYDPSQDAYRTTWTAINVGCQACHGPGREHAESARHGRPRPTPVALGADPAREVGLCARCHSVRSRLTGRDEPGEPLLDRFRPETLRPGLFHADGQQDGEVFEVASFRQSRMHEAGVRCSDCHEPHGAKLRRPGDATCTACHSPTGDPRFTAAAGRDYESPRHHFHLQGKPGSRCVDCHMPSRDYMVVHSRRDHAIRIPRPDLSERTGTPDACTSCHPQRGAAWAAEILERRRPAGQAVTPPPGTGRHYGETFAAARRGDPGALPDLSRLAADRGQPAIVRATAADLLAASGAPIPPAAFADPDPEVRAAAAG
ncbi:MAG: hypothetical protein JNM82_13185, partial [Rhodocyclaceae bacterium]|nr:hypothetical protein [Rhodocyclaceae bacterium]